MKNLLLQDFFSIVSIALYFYFINYFLIFYSSLQTYIYSISSKALIFKARGQIDIYFNSKANKVNSFKANNNRLYSF